MDGPATPSPELTRAVARLSANYVLRALRLITDLHDGELLLALAGSLGLPFETTRRHVAQLIEAGVCRRVRGGVIVPTSALANERFLEAAVVNVAYVQHFVRSLRRAGLPID